MSGFDIEHNEQALKNAVLERYEVGRQEVLRTLESDGYSEIIESVNADEYLENLEIKFKDGVDVEGQNVLQVLAYGGEIKKDDDFVSIPPSTIMQKFLGARK
ncbi:MAG: hypothetical protein ACOC1X_03180 [Promethearchaeota archaeon]